MRTRDRFVAAGAVSFGLLVAIAAFQIVGDNNKASAETQFHLAQLSADEVPADETLPAGADLSVEGEGHDGHVITEGEVVSEDVIVVEDTVTETDIVVETETETSPETN